MLTTIGQRVAVTPPVTHASVAPASGAQLDLLRNPLRARQRMTACKTASIDALWPQFITRRPDRRTDVRTDRGPTGRHGTSGRGVAPLHPPRPELKHYHQNVVDHDNASQVDCCWRGPTGDGQSVSRSAGDTDTRLVSV